VQLHPHRRIGSGTDSFAIPQLDNERQSGCLHPPSHLMNQQLIQHHTSSKDGGALS